MGPRTATEVIAEREKRFRDDPAYREERERYAAQVAAHAEQRRLASQPVLDDLRSVGVDVSSLYQVYKQPESCGAAIPVLMDHLQRPYPERVLEDIGHALPFKPAPAWWDDFKRLYLTAGSEVVRDRLASALSGCARRQHYDDLLRFVRRENLGPSRVYFLRPINRIGNRMDPGLGRSVIETLANDPVLGEEATAILRGRSRGR